MARTSVGTAHGWTVKNVARPSPPSAPPATTAAPAPAPAPSTTLEAREGPGPAQWQAVRTEICLLYGKRPLRDVRKIMLQRHGFRATERMYKARLSQWGISKNYSDKDYQICAAWHHARRQAGKVATAFVVHGHKRSLKDLHKYIKSRKMTEDDFLVLALKSVDVTTRDPQLQEQYAHVRAYTPDPDAEADDAVLPPPPPAPFIAAAPGHPPRADIATSNGRHPPRVDTAASSVSTVSPAATDPGSYSATLRDSPASLARSPHEPAAPSPADGLGAFASPAWPAMGPIGQSLHVSPPESAAYVAWPSPSRGYAVSSPVHGSPVMGASHRHSVSDTSSGTVDDQLRPAGRVHDAHTPGMACQYLGRQVEYMALQTVDAPQLKSLYGHDDLRTWRLLSDTSSSDSEDYEQICAQCHEPTKDHFISLPNLDLPQQPRRLVNETVPGVPTETIYIPGSSRGHEHSWKWVARCFSACIYMSRGNEGLSQRSLKDADVEFEAMLAPRQDPKVLLALNQTLLILHMHDQGDITKVIMQSAYSVAERLLGPDDPLSVMVRWMTYVANLKMRDRDITSATLRQIHESFASQHGYDDPRSVASLYCYGYMLNVERQLTAAEKVLREAYTASARSLGPRHLQSISALTNLNRCLERQGRVLEATQVLQQAVHDSRETLGENHPRRLESMRLLAILLERQDRLDDAERLYWKVLKGRIKMLGRNHLYTQGMKRDLERFLRRRGKWGVEISPVGPAGSAAGMGPDGGRPSAQTETVESEAQLRIQDLFEWDPDDRWYDGHSDGSDDTASQHEAY